MKKTGLFFGLLLLLASCSQDQLNPSSNAVGEAVVHLSLSTSPMIETSPVKSTRGTITTDPKEEDEINHVTVLQFKYTADGSGALLKKSSMAVSSASDIDIPLATNAVGEKSQVYVVANMGTAVFGDGIESTFRTQLSNAITTEGGFMLQNGNTTRRMPMYGQTIGAVTVTSTSTLTIKMVRLLARVEVKYKSGSISNFTVMGVRVGNIPKTMQYYRALYELNGNVLFDYPVTIPTLASTDVFTTPTQTTDVQTDLQEKTLIFYLPENHRGFGTNTGTNNEKLKDGAGTTFATYIEFEATDNLNNNLITYRFYPGKNNYNDYNLDRNTNYILSATLGKGGAADPKRVTVTNLGENSNCYLVAPSGGTVKIPITRVNEGNPSKPITSLTSPNCTVSILWQTVNSASFITLGNPTCQGGYFTVTAPSATPGNALVVIRKNLANGTVDPNGQILWSWHVWVTTGTVNTEFNPNGNLIPFMDRNLGATNTNRLDVGSFGMYYQWGRKDPLAGPRLTSSSGTDFQLLYTFSSGSLTSYTIPTVGTGPVEIATTIANPATFYAISGNWNMTPNPKLWNDVKTVYDPCPVGWRVPTLINGIVSPWLGYAVPSTTNPTWPNGVVYPYSGFRLNTGNLGSIGSYGYSYLGSVNINTMLSICMFFGGSYAEMKYDIGQANGCPVRCVRE